MKGTDSATGKPLQGIDHLRQSIRDILTTPIGSRVMRREYGSRLYELVDAPMTRETLLDIYAATAEALIRWESRLRITQISTTSAGPGQIDIAITGEYLPNGEVVTLDGIRVT